MPDISSIGHSTVGPIDRTGSNSRRDEVTRPAAPPERPGDRVELSSHAQLLDQIRRLPDTRADRIAEVRVEIREGTYATEEKLTTAIDRLLEDLV